MNPEQIKIELLDMLKTYDDEILNMQSENWVSPLSDEDYDEMLSYKENNFERIHPRKDSTKKALYATHLRKTFITGIRSLVEHI